MKIIQKKWILWEIPLLVFLAYASFWEIWNLIAGHVPALEGIISLTEEMEDLYFPFPISRWWDVPFSALYTVIFIVLITNKKLKHASDCVQDFKAILIAILIFCLVIFGFWMGLVISFTLSVAVMSFFSIVFVLSAILRNWIVGSE